MKPARAITDRDLKPSNVPVSIIWTPEIDDARLLRVTEILERILSYPVDSADTPGEGGRR